MTKQYKLAIIDFDGTICHSERAIAHSLRRTFASYNKPIPDEHAISHIISTGVSLIQTFIALDNTLATFSETILQEWKTTYRAIYLAEGLNKTELYDGAHKAFQSLTDSGTDIVILSNKGEAAVIAALTHFNLLQYTKLVIGDRLGIRNKPDPMVFNQVIQPEFPAIETSNIIVIGDTITDLVFAKNIGAASGWVTYGFGKHEECMALGPDFIFNDLKNLQIIG
ncbi:MAG: HAD family hydrolase [Gammaproteobacteria bacterium]